MSKFDYEWDVELVNPETGDIEDHMFQSSYVGCVEATAYVTTGQRADIVLVRTSDAGDRAWAYVTNGVLSSSFHDAYDKRVAAVPHRFHDEITEHALTSAD